MPCLATVLCHANAPPLGGPEEGQRRGGWVWGWDTGPRRGLGEQAGDTLMDLSPASHNHSPGHSRTEREGGRETEERGQRQRDRQRKEKDRARRERRGIGGIRE